MNIKSGVFHFWPSPLLLFLFFAQIPFAHAGTALDTEEPRISCSVDGQEAEETSSVSVQGNRLIVNGTETSLPLPSQPKASTSFSLRQCAYSSKQVALLLESQHDERFPLSRPPRMNLLLFCKLDSIPRCLEQLRLEEEKPSAVEPLGDLPLLIESDLLLLGSQDSPRLTLRLNEGLSIENSGLFECLRLTRAAEGKTVEVRTLGTSCPPDPVLWWKDMKQQQSKLQQRIPPEILNRLKLSYSSFIPTGFVPFPQPKSAFASLATGDFNCDGAADYAFAGVNRESPLGKVLLSTSQPTEGELAAAMAESKSLQEDNAAEVRIALSSGKDFLWTKTRGSYLNNAGPDCGCCNSSSKEREDAIQKEKCEFLYLGCCEKDGSFLIYQRQSTKVRFSDGC